MRFRDAAVTNTDGAMLVTACAGLVLVVAGGVTGCDPLKIVGFGISVAVMGTSVACLIRSLL